MLEMQYLHIVGFCLLLCYLAVRDLQNRSQHFRYVRPTVLYRSGDKPNGPVREPSLAARPSTQLGYTSWLMIIDDNCVSVLINCR